MSSPDVSGNIAAWTKANAEHTDGAAARQWAREDISLGRVRHPRVDDRLHRRRLRPRRRRARLRDGVHLGLARQARCASRRCRSDARAARDRAADAARDRHRVPARRGAGRERAAPGRVVRPRDQRVRRIALGRPVPLDPRGDAPAPFRRPADLPDELERRDAHVPAGGDADGAAPAPVLRHVRDDLARRGEHRVPPAARRVDPAAARARLRDRGAARAAGAGGRESTPSTTTTSRWTGRASGRAKRSGWRGRRERPARAAAAARVDVAAAARDPPPARHPVRRGGAALRGARSARRRPGRARLAPRGGQGALGGGDRGRPAGARRRHDGRARTGASMQSPRTRPRRSGCSRSCRAGRTRSYPGSVS